MSSNDYTSKYVDHSMEVESEEIYTTVRQAEPNDARAILGLSRHIGRETDYLTFGAEGINLSVEQEINLIKRFMRAKTSLMLVVEVDGQIIGIANLATLDNNKQSHVAEIGVSLISEYWGYGIGSMLLDALIDFAKDVDLKVLTLEVVTENERAIKMYRRFGFEIVGTLSKRLRSEYKYYDSYIMEKVLDV